MTQGRQPGFRRRDGQRFLWWRHDGTGRAHHAATGHKSWPTSPGIFRRSRTPHGSVAVRLARAGSGTRCARPFTRYPVGKTRGANDEFGTLSNPGSTQWEPVLADQHPYQRVPHTASVIDFLRTTRRRQAAAVRIRIRRGQRRRSVARDATLRTAGQTGRGRRAVLSRQAGSIPGGLGPLEDGRVFRAAGGFLRAEYSADGRRTALRPERPARQSQTGRSQRDRDRGPGHEWRGFVHDVSRAETRYDGRDVRSLGAAATVPVRRSAARVPRSAGEAGGRVGQRRRVAARRISGAAVGRGQRHAARVRAGRHRRRFPPGDGAAEPPFAVPIFAETVTLDVPHGVYRFLATMERGGAPAGGETVFFVADPAEMPPIPTRGRAVG